MSHVCLSFPTCIFHQWDRCWMRLKFGVVNFFPSGLHWDSNSSTVCRNALPNSIHPEIFLENFSYTSLKNGLHWIISAIVLASVWGQIFHVFTLKSWRMMARCVSAWITAIARSCSSWSVSIICTDWPRALSTIQSTVGEFLFPAIASLRSSEDPGQNKKWILVVSSHDDLGVVLITPQQLITGIQRWMSFSTREDVFDIFTNTTAIARSVCMGSSSQIQTKLCLVQSRSPRVFIISNQCFHRCPNIQMPKFTFQLQHSDSRGKIFTN